VAKLDVRIAAVKEVLAMEKAKREALGETVAAHAATGAEVHKDAARSALEDRLAAMEQAKQLQEQLGEVQTRHHDAFTALKQKFGVTEDELSKMRATHAEEVASLNAAVHANRHAIATASKQHREKMDELEAKLIAGETALVEMVDAAESKRAADAKAKELLESKDLLGLAWECWGFLGHSHNERTEQRAQIGDLQNQIKDKQAAVALSYEADKVVMAKITYLEAQLAKASTMVVDEARTAWVEAKTAQEEKEALFASPPAGKTTAEFKANPGELDKENENKNSATPGE
jgi:hypothetical protein